MAKKINKIQIFRHLIQVVLFFLLPGLYIMAFSELKTMYQMILKGNFNFIQAFPSLIEFIIVIVMTIIMGRFFCGWFCVFGAFNDLMHEISKNIFKVNFKVNEKLDSALKYVKYIILLFLVIFIWTSGSTLLQGASPWDAFAQITDFTQVLPDLIIGFILLTLITAGAVFIERFFCRYLCPLGAIFAIFSKISIFKINKPKVKCGACRACTNNCSMGLPLYKVNSAKGGECINCLKCVEACPRKNANANVMGEDLNPALAGSIAIAAFAGIYALNSAGATLLTETGLASTRVISSQSSKSSSSNYTDGTYTGSGTGFRGATTTVSVTISNGEIKNIETVSSGDTPKFYRRAASTMFDEILSSQSTSVDTVSGATFSCNGIIDAVKDALNQAAYSSAASDSSTASSENTESSNIADQSSASNNAAGETDSEKTTAAGTQSSSSTINSSINNTNSSTNNSQNATKQAEYKNGTYTGSGRGFRGGTTTVSVTISSGKISNIETVSTQDTPRFYNYTISAITDEILSSQSTSIDTVSGATYSSSGIIDAVRNALSKAV